MDFVNFEGDCYAARIAELEKEYTALKTKENEDQIELRRLRTENRLLQQRIENLEKESTTLADKLVQDQVTWAQEVEQSYALRNELSVLRQQLHETQKKLFEAEDIIGDIRARTRIIEDTVHLDEAEERNMVKHLQEELIAVRLRETDTASTIKELKLKISELEDTNLRLQRAPSNDIQQLQEELIAVKLREAEANLSMKELRMKVNEIESYWEAHMERVRQSSPKEKGTKMEIRHLQEDVMALKLKEARAVADVKDVKQKLMELETQNHICTNQIRRIGEENKELKKQLEEANEREKDLRINIKDLTRKLDDTETKRKEEAMMARIKEAEYIQQLAEFRHKIAEIDIQKEEVLAAGQLQDKGENQELKNRLHDLQDEVLQLQLSMSNQTKRTGRCVMTDSYLGNNSDEELDAEIKDSENLDRTLSDIIEGKSHSSSSNSVRENEDISTPDYGHFLQVYQTGSTTDSSAKSAHQQKATDSLVEPGEFVHRGAAENKLSSHSEEVSDGYSAGSGISKSAADGDVSIATTAVSPGMRDSVDLLQYSGESTVIADCDSAQRHSTEDNDLKGKSYPHLGSLDPALLENINTRDKTETSSLMKVMPKRYDHEKRHYKTDLLGSESCFPESWELYEEVVEVDSNMEARVISRISADRDGVKDADLRNSSERISHVNFVGGSGSCKNTPHVGLEIKAGKTSAELLLLGKAGKNSSAECAKNRIDIRCSNKNDLASEQGVESSTVDKIPDVVVIYEPSCAGSSLVCGCQDSDDQDFVLKESTV